MFGRMNSIDRFKNASQDSEIHPVAARCGQAVQPAWAVQVETESVA
jgi:hypothetical protein